MIRIRYISDVKNVHRRFNNPWSYLSMEYQFAKFLGLLIQRLGGTKCVV